MQDRPCILIIEDEPHYREFLARTLQNDYKTDISENGWQALAQLNRNTYDAILFDLRIPGISGKELVHRIRKTVDEETILIVITGFEQDWSPVEATDAHIFFYLKKGQFSPKELRKVLQNGILFRRERLEKKQFAEQIKKLNQELEKKVETRTQALFESETKYRNLFEQSLVGIYIQHKGKILLINNKLCEILGYTSQELKGRLLSDFITQAPSNEFSTIPKDLYDFSNPLEEVQLTTRKGVIRTAFHCTAPVYNQNIETIQGSILDITEWKDLEQIFLQHQKLESLGTLVSGIAHEFNNILAAMLPQAELIAQNADQDSTIQRPAQILLSMGEKATHLTRQLLNMSRKTTIEKRPVHVNTWIKDSIGFLSSTLEDSIQIQLDLDPLISHIEADPHQLDQLLLNLILNARDAMPEGGTIKISSLLYSSKSFQWNNENGKNQSSVEILVQDSGCGISSENVSKIFDPFFTTKETGKGTGLGLSVVYNLIKQIGGQIHVKSDVGRGSVFKILVPHLFIQKDHIENNGSSSKKSTPDSSGPLPEYTV